MPTPFQLYLASTSPRRQALLSQIGISFQCLKPDIDESIHPGEPPKHYADRLALAKAQAGWTSPDRTENLPVLGADTIVVFNDTILGKPKNKDDGINMLLMLSGKTHEALTSVAMVQQDRIETACSISRVTFRTLSSEEAERYWQSGEPADKAGGYGIQGRAAIFIKQIEGSHSGIMGLPLYETAELLRVISE